MQFLHVANANSAVDIRKVISLEGNHNRKKKEQYFELPVFFGYVYILNRQSKGTVTRDTLLQLN